MVLWFAGLSFVLVVLVFRDAAIDYRLVMVGALLPDVVDGLVVRGAWVLHSVLFSAVLLVAVMLATRGRRHLRRRLLALPIGTFVHLVLDGAWAATTVFWWPVLGWSFERARLPSLERPLAVNLLMELAGLAALVWCYRRFRLFEPQRRSTFLRTGRLGRDLV